jgi:hypothetical protein
LGFQNECKKIYKQKTIMATKNGIGYSPLSDKVYLGKQNTEKGMWIGAKQDVTNQFIEVSFAYFEENTIRGLIVQTEKKTYLLM